MPCWSRAEHDFSSMASGAPLEGWGPVQNRSFPPLTPPPSSMSRGVKSRTSQAWRVRRPPGVVLLLRGGSGGGLTSTTSHKAQTTGNPVFISGCVAYARWVGSRDVREDPGRSLESMQFMKPYIVSPCIH